MSEPNIKVESFFKKAKKWQPEFELLRTIVLTTGLAEELKWGHPCYTDKKRNIVLIHGFKSYCALLFFKGVLMKDPKKILIQQTDKVQSARQMRFTNAAEIKKLSPTIKSYVKEAIAIEKAGLKVEYKKTSDYAIPEEFKVKLDQSKGLKSAFAALTPGRQRAYLFYFAQAKQSKTRAARVEKYLKHILNGKGLDD